MSTPPNEHAPASRDQGENDDRVTVIGPDGRPIAVPASVVREDEDSGQRSVTDLVEEPAKVMRIGRMVQQLLEEVKAAPVDDSGRKRLANVLHNSITELKAGLAPELGEEIDRLIEPFSESTPSESELRIAQAQLVGWLEGLFHGIQTAIYAQQMSARSQLEQMRRALPAGAVPGMHQDDHEQEQSPHEPGSQGGMYL
jgi:hypothetical protein